MAKKKEEGIEIEFTESDLLVIYSTLIKYLYRNPNASNSSAIGRITEKLQPVVIQIAERKLDI